MRDRFGHIDELSPSLVFALRDRYYRPINKIELEMSSEGVKRILKFTLSLQQAESRLNLVYGL